jgi:hypothetical protein
LAEEIYAQKNLEASRKRPGLTDSYKEHRQRPLIDHLKEYCKCLLAEGNTPAYAQMTCTRVLTVAKGCKFERIGDLSSSAVLNFLKEKKIGPKKKPISIRTRNAYLQAVKAFANWLVDDHRAPNNPIAHLSQQNTKLDVRLERPRLL